MTCVCIRARYRLVERENPDLGSRSTSVCSTFSGVSMSRMPSGSVSAPLVEGRRLDPERAQVDVALPAMMDLVVDDVEDEIVQHARILAERRQRLLEPLGRDLPPQRVELLPCFRPTGAGCSAFGRGSRLADVFQSPESAPRTIGTRHREHLERERAERPHAADREGEQLVVGKRVDDAPGQPAVSLPVGQQRFGRDEASWWSSHDSTVYHDGVCRACRV